MYESNTNPFPISNSHHNCHHKMEELNFKDCTATFTLKPNYGCRGRLFHLSGRVTHPRHGSIAFLDGYAIQRRHEWVEAGNFMRTMHGENLELKLLTHQVFDNLLEVYPWIYNDTRRSGSGVWGKELNEGDIFFIEFIKVDDKVNDIKALVSVISENKF